MYRSDTGPAERRCRDRRGDCALRLRDDPKLPRALGCLDGEVLHHPVDLVPGRVRLVADLEHRAAVLDSVAVDVAPKELTSVQTARHGRRDGGPEELLFPENRIL